PVDAALDVAAGRQREDAPLDADLSHVHPVDGERCARPGAPAGAGVVVEHEAVPPQAKARPRPEVHRRPALLARLLGEHGEDRRPRYEQIRRGARRLGRDLEVAQRLPQRAQRRLADPLLEDAERRERGQRDLFGHDRAGVDAGLLAIDQAVIEDVHEPEAALEDRRRPPRQAPAHHPLTVGVAETRRHGNAAVDLDTDARGGERDDVGTVELKVARDARGDELAPETHAQVTIEQLALDERDVDVAGDVTVVQRGAAGDHAPPGHDDARPVDSRDVDVARREPDFLVRGYDRVHRAVAWVLAPGEE